MATTPEDRYYNPAKINAWFAVSAVLVLATTVACVLADHYEREWKRWQHSFQALERERARETLALRTADPASLPPGASAIRDRLLRGEGKADAGPSALDAKGFEAALEAVRAKTDFPAGAVLAARVYDEEAAAAQTPDMVAKKREIEAARDKAENDRFKAEKDQREFQALADELRFRKDHAFAHGQAAEAAETAKAWEETVAKEREVHARMDAAAIAKADRTKELRALLAPASDRQDRARRLYELAGVAGAERKVQSFVAQGLRDAPILDAFAPATKIDQRVFPDLTVDYNFAQVGRVDRCITCHTGIDKVRVDPVSGAVTPVFTAENTPERVFRTHPRPELFCSSVSRHPVDKMGCTICHDGLGWGLTFADAYHTPSTAEQEEEWEKKFHWHRGESWDVPMLPQKHIEASCFKCHRDQMTANPEDKFSKEIPGAPKWNRGQHIVERRGCFGCHKIDGYAVPGLDKWITEIKDEDRRGYAMASSIRKTGPSLKRIASKWTSRDGAWKWISHPQDLRPSTNMPHFFGQPNNSGMDALTHEDYDLRTSSEIWGIVEYLWTESERFEAAPPPVKGDAERGKELFGGAGTVGCVACHTTKDFPNPEEGGRPNDFGPDLSALGSKVPEAWIYGWLKNPSEYWEGTRMPSLRLTDQEAADVSAYLVSLRGAEWEKKPAAAVSDAEIASLAVEAVRAAGLPGRWLEPYGDDRKASDEANAKAMANPNAFVEGLPAKDQRWIVGQRAITRYACFGCHEIKGFEKKERIGTDLLAGNEGWGSKDVDRLDFGLMEDEHAVATYGDWHASLLPHRKPEWVRLKLLNPRVFDAGITKQPHEKLVMPNFHFTDEEADAVVTFLLSLQKGEVPAAKRRLRDAREILAEKMKWIVRQYNCYGCHTVTRQIDRAEEGKWVVKPRGGDVRPWIGDNADNWPPSLGGEGVLKEGKVSRRMPLGEYLHDPGRDVGEGTRVQPAWLFRFLRDPGSNVLRFWLSARMPTFHFSQQELNGIVQGFAARESVPFPFEFKQAEELKPKDREEAAELFRILDCMKCHPTKGAKTEGPPPSGLAPDLTFAHERLRYEWVKLWLDDPNKILPGTKMPPFWRAQDDLAAPKGKYIQRPYFGDDPHAQMRYIADYVFEIGAPKSEGSK